MRILQIVREYYELYEPKTDFVPSSGGVPSPARRGGSIPDIIIFFKLINNKKAAPP